MPVLGLSRYSGIAPESSLNALSAKVRLLYHLGSDFDGLDAAAMWDDTKVGLKHWAAWERCAVVTDHDWLRHMTKAFGFVMPGEVRVFADAELDATRAWLSE